MKIKTVLNNHLLSMVLMPMVFLSAKPDWTIEHTVDVPFFSHRPYKLFVDTKNNTIGGLLQDAIFTYSLEDKTIHQTSINRLPYPSARTIFDPFHRKIHAYYAGSSPVSTWMEGKQYFEPIHSVELNERTHFGHASFVDTSGNIYTLGGSEDHSFTNEFRQYNFNKHHWEQITLKGPAFFPRRHMAICPTGEPNHYYIFGGEGNESGEKGKPFTQLSELWLLDLTKKEISLIWTYTSIEKPYTPFGIVFHEISRSLYILHSLDQPGNVKTQKWQLIHTPIDQPHFTKLGSPIESASIISNPLFFSKDSTQLMCLTFDPNMTAKPDRIPIHISGFPIHPIVAKPNLSFWILVLGLLTGITTIILKLYYKRSSKKDTVSISPSDIAEDLEYPAIDFFGEFYASDQDGNNVSSAFTPKLKELFLLIFLYSFPNRNVMKQKGVSTQKLSTILWPNSSPNSVKNQRSVAISRLKDILKNFSSLQLKYNDKFWAISIDGLFSSDYLKINTFLDKQSLSNNELLVLTSILQKGQFLEGLDSHWLDPIKEELTSKILNELVEYSQQMSIKGDNQMISQIGNAILAQDELSEQGIFLKVRSLKKAKQLTQAKTAFEHYCGTYKEIIGESYPKSFQDII